MSDLTDPSFRARIEQWIGPIEADAEEDIESRLSRLAVPEVAALEVLLTRQAMFMSMATSVASGDDRVDHSENLKRIGGLIASLVAVIEGDSNITLTGDSERVVNAAKGDQSHLVSTFEVVAENPRRG